MKLNVLNRISYGMGGSVYAVKESAYSIFILLFYTQVLGLSGVATGFVLFLSILWDAISDPIMGAWTDRFQSRWGRRHPFLVASAFPLGLGFLALFNPPSAVLSDQTFLAAWLLGCSLWIRTALTVFAIPHLALVAEMTQDYHERSAMLGMRTGLLFITTLLLPAYGLYFLFNLEGGVDGRFVASNYVTFGWISAFIVWISASIAIAGTWEFTKTKQDSDSKMPSGQGLAGFWKDLIATFTNINFRNLLYYDLAASSSYGIIMALNTIFWTYYWELDAQQTSIALALPVITAVPLALLTIRPIGQIFPKHIVLRMAVIAMLIDISWMYPLRMLDMIPENGHISIFVMLMIQNFLFMYFFILRIVAASSIIADLTDEHEAVSGKRQEGGFYSIFHFTTKLGTAIGPLYGGLALDLIGMTEDKLPGQYDQSSLNGLVWALAVVVVPLMLIAYGFAKRVSMTKEQLAEIQERIRLRRDESGPGENT